jgi:hypothetical protein
LDERNPAAVWAVALLAVWLDPMLKTMLKIQRFSVVFSDC